jgi:nitrogen regulatory protein PII
MKLVIAVIRPEQLPAVKQALFDAQVSLFRRIEVKVAVNDSQVETAIDAISRGAHDTGGWGRIMVQPLEDVVTIWTGVRGPRAL